MTFVDKINIHEPRWFSPLSLSQYNTCAMMRMRMLTCIQHTRDLHHKNVRLTRLSHVRLKAKTKGRQKIENTDPCCLARRTSPSSALISFACAIFRTWGKSAQVADRHSGTVEKNGAETTRGRETATASAKRTIASASSWTKELYKQIRGPPCSSSAYLQCWFGPFADGLFAEARGLALLGRIVAW